MPRHPAIQVWTCLLCGTTVALLATGAIRAEDGPPQAGVGGPSVSGAVEEAAGGEPPVTWTAFDPLSRQDSSSEPEGAELPWTSLLRLTSLFQPPAGAGITPRRQFEASPELSAGTGELTRAFGTSAVRPGPDDLKYRATPSIGRTTNVEAKVRAATDGGNSISKSHAASLRTSAQKRNEITTAINVNSQPPAETGNNGSYWFPARLDLDTMLSKIDSRVVEEMLVIKGPYTARLGPGFSFVDIELLKSHRFDGYQSYGSSSLEYKSNGEQWYGQQYVWGGGDNWGYRVGYGNRTGNDYRTGTGSRIPSSYRSRDWFVALGYDLSDDSHLEFHGLRLDQTDVEFPGMAFDINYLVTDAYELEYTLENQGYFDLLSVEGWYNRTRFAGDDFRQSKRDQIPEIVPLVGNAITDDDALSAGYRAAVSRGNACSQLTVGTDLIYLSQALNDIQLNGLPVNFPIPRSYSRDFGLFAEHVRTPCDPLTIRSGARLDWVFTTAQTTAENAFIDPLTDYFVSEFERDFFLWSAFVTGEYRINECWTATCGFGYAERPPTMTELYAAGPFIGVLQSGLTSVSGDPQLDHERLKQFDVGLHADFDRLRFSGNGFFSWIHDFITYDDNTNVAGLQFVDFVNTPRATLFGFDFAGEFDMSEMVTLFATASYVEGADRSRSRPSRLRQLFNPGTFRSGTAGDKEPLPGISPFESRAGVWLRDPNPEPRWTVEVGARVVDDQDRIATSLLESATPGFTVWDVRGYWQPRPNLLLTAGVENFTDRFYREHLDYRPGLGVFRPGVNFYFGSELTY